MTFLDNLPVVDTFFGIDLKTGAIIIAVLSIVHPMAYGCTFCVPMSYLLLSIWISVALYFAASILLFCGLLTDDAILCSLWIWYACAFVVVMVLMMILLAVVFTSRNQGSRVFMAVIGILYYLGTIYFIIVVNSHLKRISKSA